LHERVDELGAAGRIRFTGWLDDDVLDGLYRAATCFVFPSLAEGFGLPVLDALVRGTPVACSNATSLPEVAGDAALYFEPTDIRAISAAIERLLQDSALRDRLRATGPEQARKFSWRRTAARTLGSYERVLASRSPI
jgi:glycosyltransferase involved in cell wall biosynthesis